MESKDGKEDKNVNALLSLPDSTKTLGKKSKSREVNPSGLKRKVSQDTRRMPQKDKPAISGASPKTAGHKNGKESFCGPEEKYALAFKYSPIGICISSLQDGRYVEVNEVYSNFLGYRREELIGRTSSEINLWVDMAERDALVRELLEKGTVTDFQLRFRDRNGHVHWGNVAAALVTIGQELYVLTQTQDVTDKKKIKEQFEKSEAKYRLLAENLTDVIFTIDMNFNYTYASPSTYHLLGYTAEELMTMKVENLVDPETLAWFMEMLAEEMEIEKRPDRDLKRSRVLEYQHIRKDGSTIWVENKITFLRDQDNNAIGIIGTVRDIAERKRAEEQVCKEIDFNRSVLDSLTVPFFMFDTASMTFFRWNKTFSAVSGYSDEELGQMRPSALISEHQKDFLLAKFEEFQRTGHIAFEMPVLSKNGSVTPYLLSGNLLHHDGKPFVVGMGIDITERKKAEESLRRSEEKYRTILENMEEGYFEVDLSGNFTFFNDATCRHFGYSREEMTGMKNRQYMDEKNSKALYIVFNRIYETDQPVTNLEWQIIRKDGAKRDIEGFVFLLKDVAGTPIGFRGIVRDITERKQVQEKLHRERQLFKSVTEQSSDIIIIADTRGRITYENPAVEKILGYRVEERLGASGYDLVHPDDAQIVADAAGKLFHNIQAPVQKGEIRLHHKNGSWRTFEVTASNLVKDHVVEAAIVNMHDITARKRSEELIRQSEAKYRLLADNMKDYVWLMDLNLKINYISPSVERLMGYSLEDFKKFSLDKFLTVQSFQAAMDFFAIEMPKALGAPPDYVLERSLELEFCCKNGQTVWGECNFSLIRDDKGKPLSLLGVSRNINERKQMEDALRKSEENFRHSLDDSPLGVRISTVEGKTLYANRAILDMYGYDSKEELQNTPLQERYTPETFEAFKERKKKRLKGQFGPSEYEISIIRKDGEIRHLHVFRKEIFWNGQKQSQVIYEDITLRRRAENRLNETLESLRQSIKITIQVLGTASEAKDPYMAGHQRRVADLARAIATEMKLPQDKIEAIRMASAIHDIGKISVPAEILCKPAILSDIEFSFVKNHPRYSYDIMKEVESPWPLADIVYQHHERMDGSGYPLGLKNDEILIESRILAVADVVEAMISYRPYRPALALEMALAEIEDNAGTLYDAEVVKACLRLFRDKNYQMS